MAEGFTGGDPQERKSADLAPVEATKFSGWLISTLRGRLIMVAAAAAIVLAGVTAWHAFGTPILASSDAKSWFIAGTSILLLPLLLMLLDSSRNMAKGPRLPLPLATLGMLLALAVLAALDTALGLHILIDEDNAPQTPRLIAFFAFLCVALLPRIASAIQFTIYRDGEAERRQREADHKLTFADSDSTERAEELQARVRDQNDAEALGAVVATLTVLGIGSLAFFVGGWSQGASLRSAVGVGISIGVIGLFTVVVFLDWIAEFAPVRLASRAMRGFSRRMAWLASFYNAIDAVLVRIGAHVAGTEHHKPQSRYAILAGTLACLGVMAFFLPAPFGLIPGAIGCILALSVSRLWSWVEDDRNLALITRFHPDAPQKVGFREDFKDETLLGFIFVLVLIPVMMMQIDRSELFGAELFKGSGKDEFPAWLGYFGFELAKALPVVDWADIYNVRAGDDLLQPNGAIGMHAVFFARATVDLVLIASLLQVLAITTRNRQQKSLYAAKQIDRLDVMVEREELKRALNNAPENWFKGPVDFQRYNQDRLKEIFYDSPNDEKLQKFIRTIFERGGWTLDPAVVVLDRIAKSNPKEDQLYRTFDAVQSEFQNGKYVPIGDFLDILESLRNKPGLEELKTNILNFLPRLGSPYEAAEVLMPVITGGTSDRYQYTRVEAARVLAKIAPALPEAGQILDAIEEIEMHRVDAFGSKQGEADNLLAALRERLKDLAPPATQTDENKP